MKESHMSKSINSVEQLVDAWGGTNEFARWADVGPSAVSNWKAQGYIPEGYHLRLFLEARGRGLDLAPSLFGFKRWPDPMDGKPRPKQQAVA
jgi:hypothetical protein